IDRLEGDRVGLIAFAGYSHVLCPLTLDYGAAKMFLKDADVTLIPEQGTAVAEAIRTAMRGFGSDDRKYKALILITDGENHVNDPIAVAEEAAEAGIRVFAVGVGTSEGELIPIRNGDRVDYLKDTEGKIVKTRLDEATLKEIARVTDGLYVRASGGGIGLQAVYAQIAEMEKRDLGTQKYAQYIHRFQWPLALALMCFAGEALLSDRRKGVEEWRGRFEA
ncbi:MAG: VWA domain-containing protein, partial [Candidatus Latescibacteria bacterium]|nr:VWA domain-containing protein [Candidatus Latescibacterota bacterium]